MFLRSHLKDSLLLPSVVLLWMTVASFCHLGRPSSIGPSSSSSSTLRCLARGEGPELRSCMTAAPSYDKLVLEVSHRARVRFASKRNFLLPNSISMSCFLEPTRTKPPIAKMRFALLRRQTLQSPNQAEWQRTTAAVGCVPSGN